MKKRIIALLLAALCVVSLTSCGKQDDTYTDNDGTEYLVVRDSDGNIVINDSGKLQVYSLNENGKKQKSDTGDYMTEYIDFNGQVVSERKVETAEMRFTIPDGFSDSLDNPGYFYKEDYDAEIFFGFYAQDVEKAKDSIAYNCESLLESYGSEYFSYEQYTVPVDGTDCAVYKQNCTSGEYYRTAYFYFIPYDSGYYAVNCIVNTGYAKKVDFDRFVESISFK